MGLDRELVTLCTQAARDISYFLTKQPQYFSDVHRTSNSITFTYRDHKNLQIIVHKEED